MAFETLPLLALAIMNSLESLSTSLTSNFNPNDLETKKLYDKFKDKNIISLPRYVRDTQLHSRTFIQQSLAEEDAVKDVVNNLYNIYAGYIVTALQMENYVSKNKTIKEFFETISTENISFVNTAKLLSEKLNFDMSRIQLDKQNDKIVKRTISNINVSKDTPKPIDLPSGKIISLNLKGQVIVDDTDTISAVDKAKEEFDIQVSLAVYLHPTFIPEEVAEQFVAYNFNTDMTKRFMQWSAGEIQFWNDFVLQQDILAKRRKALVKDKTGILAQMLHSQNNALAKALIQQSDITNKTKRNIANSILIFEKNSFDRWCKEQGINFNNVADRAKFFNKTFSMITVLMDTMFDRSHFYFNGIPYSGTYTSKQLRANVKDTFDMKDWAKFFAQGQTLKM